MERQWLTLDQIKAEYASNDYNPELLLQHLLHHVEASPASVPEGWVEWMQNIDSAMKEPIFQEARALMGTENYGQDVSLLQALRLVRRRMLSAAPTPPVSEDRWQPIETAPRDSKTMFVVIGITVDVGNAFPYTTDPWCVWRTLEGRFERWPHKFQPTHWMPLPKSPVMQEDKR